MIVDPTFMDHHKTSRLRAILGKDREAPIYILRLWAYCQTARKDTIENNADVIADICRYKGHADSFLDALIKLKILDVVDDETLRVHEFNDYNRSLIAVRANAEKARSKANRKHSAKPSIEDSAKPSIEDSAKPSIEDSGEGGLDRIGLDNTPKPPDGDCEWEVKFLSELRKTGKFPALTFEALKFVIRDYPKAELHDRWPQIVEEAGSLPSGVVNNPSAWLRTAISKLEARLIFRSEKKEGGEDQRKKERAAQVFHVLENPTIGGMR